MRFRARERIFHRRLRAFGAEHVLRRLPLPGDLVLHVVGEREPGDKLCAVVLLRDEPPLSVE
eukprot:5772609-Prymnesium_polylepis.1